MKKQIYILLIIAGLLTCFSSCKKEADYKALIITGQNNHNWKASSPVLKKILDETGMFTSEIMITPEKGGDMTLFNPVFSKYDLVVLDYNDQVPGGNNGNAWTAKTDTAFLEYVRNGGGVVVYHAADNAFPGWAEYNKIIGLGGWGNRNEKSGPYVYYKGDKIVRDDTSKGIGGTHGARSEFIVKTRNFEHPITKGLPANWLHGNDELYSLLRGPAENMEILATAFSRTREPNRPPADAASGGANKRPSRSAPAGRDEPILMTVKYGKGRIFHTVLGHADEGGGPAMQCAGFIVTFQRGAEWAASGKVTQEVPFDFPSAAGVVLRPDFKEVTIEEDMANIVNYDIGKSTKYYTDIQANIRMASGNAIKLQRYERMMVEILKNANATIEAKKLMLRELSWMGSEYCIKTVKDLAANADLKDEAEFTLARLQPVK
jgi:type 1 glutamine amidotransferase